MLTPKRVRIFSKLNYSVYYDRTMTTLLL